MKAKVNLKNIIAYVQGNIRYKLYYSKYKWLIPNHILQQIDIRIKTMNKQCYNTGSCLLCGCKTTHLQMANKACDGDCYPKMLSLKDWQTFKRIKILNIDGVVWQYKLDKFVKYGMAY